MRALGIASFLLACAGTLFADDPPARSDRIRARLASDAPVEAAWGLHDAIEARLPNAGDAIRGVLTRWEKDSTWAGRQVRAAAIDAAILLDVDLAPSAWRPFASDLGTSRLLILVARSPADHRDLLHPVLTTYQEDDAWTAACNLLLPLRDHVLTAHLLGRLRVEARVTVRDPGPEDEFSLPHSGGQIFVVGTGCARVSKPEVDGWPPRYYWKLLGTASPGSRLVANGRESIYAERRALETGGFVCCRKSDGSRDYAAGQYLADLLGWDVDELRSSLSEYETVEFAGLDAWAKALEDLKRDLCRDWLRLLAACFLDGLLSPVDALALPPRVEMHVYDERKVHEPALPGALRR